MRHKESPLSLEEKVYSYGAVRGTKDSINVGNCVKYTVEGQVIATNISNKFDMNITNSRKKLDS